MSMIVRKFKNRSFKIDIDETPKRTNKSKILINSISNFFYKNAYIITNVLMLVWSIIYHSWFGFALLLWANIIWIRSDQRGNMMSSSPALVVYATCLLLMDYIYGMNFNNRELPVKLESINLKQLGFEKYEHPSIHLLLKSVFTASFWLTLRIWLKERSAVSRKQTLNLADVAHEIIDTQQAAKTYPAFLKIVRKTCVFCWMWIIVFTLIVMAVTGHHMNFFRIVNMSFAFVFILLFQVSFKFWLKSMITFWTILIIYAMIAVSTIYASQFDHFPETGSAEIGLTISDTGDLFKSLLSFTMVIILTGFQIHHFHQKFIDHFEQKLQRSTSTESSDEVNSVIQYYHIIKPR